MNSREFGPLLIAQYDLILKKKTRSDHFLQFTKLSQLDWNNSRCDSKL